MNTDNFRDFEEDARTQGFDEVIERRWEPGVTLDTHVHPFAVKALVVRGEMWLIVGDHTRHLRTGDTFELARDVPHAERYGNEGATYWVARRRQRERRCVSHPWRCSHDRTSHRSGPGQMSRERDILVPIAET